MAVKKKIFGYLGETPVFQYTLRNRNGVEADIITYGGAVRSLRLPAQEGVIDVVLGYETLADYMAHDKYMGAIIGRVSNRTGGGRFSIDGKEYRLCCNNGPNHLHGGLEGFDKKVWQSAVQDDSLCLSLISPEGEEGYPGELATEVVYRLTEDNRLIMEIKAESSATTPVSITNHCYFNLNGHDYGDIRGHHLTLNASSYLPIDENGLPTGAIVSVEGTPFDFRGEKVIGGGLMAENEQIRYANGYDHSFLLEKGGKAAICRGEKGITLTLSTTQSALHFYSGNFLDGVIKGKEGACYNSRSGFCLEAQTPPNAVNMFPGFKPLLEKGDRYEQRIEYKFDFN